ncbi:MAG TPA: hypothetical protein VIN60_10240 [Anaerolineales bacterium]
MTIPDLVLGLIVALLIGALFHLFLDGGVGRLFLYLALSLIGSAAGQYIGSRQKWILFPIGTLNLGMAIIGSLVVLIVGYWFSLVRIRPEGGDDAV